jgi:hypothetical protein
MTHEEVCNRVTEQINNKLGPRMYQDIDPDALHPYREGASYRPVSHTNNLLTLELDEITRSIKHEH